jgi:hypothetical protein
LTRSQRNDFHHRLELKAAEGENLFGNKSDISDIKVQEFVKTQTTDLFSFLVETCRNQAPDLVRKAGLSEAVFSHKGDYHPILATDSLATCIGVAGYDPANQFGFVIHFTCEGEITASGPLLLERIRTYREQNNQAPLLIHLRGGIKGMSEPLLAKVKEWLMSYDFMTIIASDSTLHFEIPGSIKLDVRTGTCETYDDTSNPYSLDKKKNVEELTSTFFTQLFVEVATKKPEIYIAYDSKGH